MKIISKKDWSLAQNHHFYQLLGFLKKPQLIFSKTLFEHLISLIIMGKWRFKIKNRYPNISSKNTNSNRHTKVSNSKKGETWLKPQFWKLILPKHKMLITIVMTKALQSRWVKWVNSLRFGHRYCDLTHVIAMTSSHRAKWYLGLSIRSQCTTHTSHRDRLGGPMMNNLILHLNWTPESHKA